MPLIDEFVVQDPVMKIQYYIHHRNEREKQILEFLSADKGAMLTALDLVKGIYVDLDPSLYLAAEHNVEMHLKKLEKEGKVSRQVSLWSSI